MAVARAAREMVWADAVCPERSLHACHVRRDHAVYRIEIAPQTGHVVPNALALRRQTWQEFVVVVSGQLRPLHDVVHVVALTVAPSPSIGRAALAVRYVSS